jgi:hypothetical protein
MTKHRFRVLTVRKVQNLEKARLQLPLMEMETEK